jgi:hypothetical protein
MDLVTGPALWSFSRHNCMLHVVDTELLRAILSYSYCTVKHPSHYPVLYSVGQLHHSRHRRLLERQVVNRWLSEFMTLIVAPFAMCRLCRE